LSIPALSLSRALFYPIALTTVKMCTNKILPLAAVLLSLQPALAAPFADNAPAIILPRNGTTGIGNQTIVVDPPKDPKPDITEIPEMTQEELQHLIETLKDGGAKLQTRTYGVEELAAKNEELVSADLSLLKRQNQLGNSTNGPFLSYLGGDDPDPKCENFVVDGPFTYMQ
jgi:hypothetical protein